MKQFICIKCNKEFENQYDIEVRVHKLENDKDHSVRSKRDLNKHQHNLVGYWGGWKCINPRCTTKKYQELDPND